MAFALVRAHSLDDGIGNTSPGCSKHPCRDIVTVKGKRDCAASGRLQVIVDAIDSKDGFDDLEQGSYDCTYAHRAAAEACSNSIAEAYRFTVSRGLHFSKPACLGRICCQ
jgi:hypothetical protein